MFNLNTFKENGYIICKSVTPEVLHNLRLTLFDMLQISYKKHLGVLSNFEKFSINEINRIFIELENQDHSHITKIFDNIRNTDAFYKLVNNELHIDHCKKLLSVKNKSSVFLNSLSLRMDPPNSIKFSYGWHRDADVNVDKSEFIQAWIPLVDIDETLGGLEIIKNSHVNEFKTEHTDYVKNAVKNGKKKSDPIVYRLPHDTKIITPGAEELTLTANFGETIFFSNKLMHRSGLNHTNNKVRFAITAFYHRSDILESDWF